MSLITSLSTSTGLKEEVLNQNNAVLQAIAFGIISRILTEPPETPSSNGFYIPASPATGAWETHENKLLFFHNSSWLTFTAPDGFTLRSNQENAFLKFASGIWSAIAIGNAVFMDILAPRSLAQFDNGVMLDWDDNNSVNIGLDSEVVAPGFNCHIRKVAAGDINLITVGDAVLQAKGNIISEQFAAAYIAYKGNDIWVAIGALSI